MAHKDEPAIGPVEDKLADEVVERLMDRTDASGPALLGEGGLPPPSDPLPSPPPT